VSLVPPSSRAVCFFYGEPTTIHIAHPRIPYGSTPKETGFADHIVTVYRFPEDVW